MKKVNQPLYIKILKRTIIAIVLICYVILVKMPLAVLSVLMAALIELFDILLGFILRKKIRIDYEWPKLKYEWVNTENFLKSAFIDFLSN